jgi:hypothetical protein
MNDPEQARSLLSMAEKDCRALSGMEDEGGRSEYPALLHNATGFHGLRGRFPLRRISRPGRRNRSAGLLQTNAKLAEPCSECSGTHVLVGVHICVNLRCFRG